MVATTKSGADCTGVSLVLVDQHLESILRRFAMDDGEIIVLEDRVLIVRDR